MEYSGMKRMRFTILFLTLFFIADYFLSVAHFSTIIHKYDIDTNTFEDVFVADAGISDLCCKENDPLNTENSFNRLPQSISSVTCAECPVIGNGVSKISFSDHENCCKFNLSQHADSLPVYGLSVVVSDKILLYAPKNSPPFKTA
jgi:hypothetical protein